MWIQLSLRMWCIGQKQLTLDQNRPNPKKGSAHTNNLKGMQYVRILKIELNIVVEDLKLNDLIKKRVWMINKKLSPLKV